MEKQEFIYFTLGAVSLMVGMLAYGPMKQLWYAVKSSISHRKPTQSSDIQSQIDELGQQLDNLAERLATRDSNRKNNTRKVVREYLEELKNSK